MKHPRWSWSTGRIPGTLAAAALLAGCAGSRGAVPAPLALSGSSPASPPAASPAEVEPAASAMTALPPLLIEPHLPPAPNLGLRLLIYRIDFGTRDHVFARSTPYDADRAVPYAFWRGGMARVGDRPKVIDSYLRDFIEGEDAVLELATAPAESLRAVLTVGDAARERGPFDLLVNGRTVARDLATGPGEFLDVEFVLPPGDRVELHLAARDCRSFAVNGVAVYGFSGGVTARFAPPAAAPAIAIPDSISPVLAGMDRNERKGAAHALRDYGEYLLENRPPEGCFAMSGNWYESAYPIRTLILASAILKDRRYREAAFDCLDRFVDEQQPDGGWASQYFGKRTCDLARDTRDGARSRNLADVGTMAMCLSIAAPWADRDRRALYVRAARAYADSVVLPNQLESGAFPNLNYEGTVYRHPYTVATAVQAADISALYAVTGDRRYREAARRAAVFLAGTIREDGSVLFYPYDQPNPRVTPPDRLGDLFYLLEGLVWAHRYADKPTRALILRALDRYFSSPNGLASWPSPEAWMAKESPWENSKRAGMLFLLAQYASLAKPSPAQEAWTSSALRYLEDRDRSPKSGVLSSLDGPAGRHALAATGFAGLGMGSLAKLDALFPPPPRNRK